jgi:hypothetical protein
MISGSLYDVVKDKFVCKLLDLVTVVGREQCTFVYEVLCERNKVEEEVVVCSVFDNWKTNRRRIKRSRSCYASSLSA